MAHDVADPRGHHEHSEPAMHHNIDAAIPLEWGRRRGVGPGTGGFHGSSWCVEGALSMLDPAPPLVSPPFG
ncbi:hypothetical protein ARZXY2_3472 [Arthrobacter sp. ZXY-2]|nr:hypothetical protein ARZXY2_3472 [Arthrobacter sp. ZXY-2]